MERTFQPLSDADAAAEARRLINAGYQPETEPLAPTSYRDTTEVPKVGDTPPVPQPDRRLVPQWAAGIAVASIGVGAGVTGTGCGVWLILRGLSSITLMGVLETIAPFAGLAAAATAVAMAISRACAGVSTTHNHYEGDVHQHTENTTTTHNRGLFVRNHNDLPHS